MKKYQIKLNSKEKELLERIIMGKSIDKRKKLKAKVILAKSKKMKIKTIMKMTGLSKRTIISYTKQYIENKDKFLHRDNYTKSELFDYRYEIFQEFSERPPLSDIEAAARVEKLTGIKRSPTQVKNFLVKRHIYTARTKRHILCTQRKKLITKTNKYKEELKLSEK